MKRILIYSHLDAAIGELSENDVLSCIRREEINGEHSLEITTIQVLEKGQRIVYCDNRGYWREYVVAGIDENHSAGKSVIGTYYCVWSIQQDLQGVTVSLMPGVQTPVTASVALNSLLSAQSRWARGTVTNTNTGGASMYDMNAWNAIGVLIDNWGGELSTSFNVSDNSGIIARYVDLYSKMGAQTSYRRFDFGADLKSVRRIMDDSPLYCRISPRGKGEQTEGGGYGRKITIESVNSGKDYLEYAPMVDVAKIRDTSNTYIYPTLIVENSNCETPAELKTWAEGVLAEYCTPNVTYEIDVIQAAQEGVDAQGVSLGDSVDVVDRKFRDDGLRLSGRVVSMVVDEITGKSVTVTIGALEQNIASKFSNDGTAALIAINTLTSAMSTAAYIDDLLTRINAEISADGGYTYIIPANGMRTYDAEVTDPLVGAEASKVVEIKGGAIRIANSKTAQGAWEWKTVFTSGHIAANLVTAANIITGYIGSAGDTYIDLDNHTVQLGQSSSKHLVVSTSAMEYFDGNTSVIRASQAANVPSVRIGPAAEPHVVIDGTAMRFYDDSDQIASFGKTTNGKYSITIGDKSSDLYSVMNPSGFSVRRDASSTLAYFGLDSNGVPICRLGEPDTSYIYLSGEGSIDINGGGERLAHFGYALGKDAEGEDGWAPYADIGYRHPSSTIGGYSVAEGYDTYASGWASHAGGDGCRTTEPYSFAFGNGSRAQHEGAFALGYGCRTGESYQTVIGGKNVATSAMAFIVGDGRDSEDPNKNLLTLSFGSGNLWISGTLTQNSDRRLKEHLKYLDDDACDFVRKLKPALFVKDGERHLGFYAQNVRDVDEWDTSTVKAQHSDESLDFDPLTLDYPALIAPLVAYAQSLESRIEALEKKLESLEI